MNSDKSIKILAFDTAANACSAALWVAGDVVAARHEVMVRGQAEALAPMIADLFEEAPVLRDGFAELDAISVTVGPGTFTGVRIGLAMARALALPRQLPIIGLTTIDAVHWQSPTVKTPLLVALETKRDDFYIQLFDHAGTAAMAPSALTAEQVLAHLPSEPVTLVGDGAERLALALAEAGGPNSQSIGSIMPIAGEFVALAAERLQNGVLGDAEPLYLRSPSVTLPATK
mgnify:CR=1 FL=1